MNARSLAWRGFDGLACRARWMDGLILACLYLLAGLACLAGIKLGSATMLTAMVLITVGHGWAVLGGRALSLWLALRQQPMPGIRRAMARVLALPVLMTIVVPAALLTLGLGHGVAYVVLLLDAALLGNLLILLPATLGIVLGTGSVLGLMVISIRHQLPLPGQPGFLVGALVLGLVLALALLWQWRQWARSVHDPDRQARLSRLALMGLRPPQLLQPGRTVSGVGQTPPRAPAGRLALALGPPWAWPPLGSWLQQLAVIVLLVVYYLVMPDQHWGHEMVKSYRMGGWLLVVIPILGVQTARLVRQNVDGNGMALVLLPGLGTKK